MKAIIKRFVRDESGATAIEYGLIAAGIAVAIIAPVKTVEQTEHDVHKRIKRDQISPLNCSQKKPRCTPAGAFSFGQHVPTTSHIGRDTRHAAHSCFGPISFEAEKATERE